LPSLADYLKLAGGTMTGNLDLAGNKLLTTDLLLKQGIATRFDFKNLADDSFRDIGLRSIWLQQAGIIFMKSTSYISCQSGAASYWTILSHNGSDYQEVARFVGGHADIPRAGDITQLAGKTATLRTTNVYGDLSLPEGDTINKARSGKILIPSSATAGLENGAIGVDELGNNLLVRIDGAWYYVALTAV